MRPTAVGPPAGRPRSTHRRMTLESALQHAAFAVSIVVLAALFTLGMIRWVRVMDIPNARSSHARPIPRSGGLAVVSAIAVGMLVYQTIGQESLLPLSVALRFMAALGLIFVVSVIDDVKALGVRSKLTTQVVAALVVVSSGLHVRTLDVPWLGAVDLGLIGAVLTLVWLVALTNAFNFMDGLDGLAGTQAVVAGLFLSGIALAEGSHFVFVFAYITAAACLGFLVFNRPPARIFMGDTGSQFLGFTFGLLGVMANQFDRGEVTVMVVPVLFFSFLWDTAFTLIRRRLAGDPLVAHRTHLYQLMNRSGLSHARVTLIYGGLAVVQGVAAVIMVHLPGATRLLVFPALIVLMAVISAIVVRRARRLDLL